MKKFNHLHRFTFIYTPCLNNKKHHKTSRANKVCQRLCQIFKILKLKSRVINRERKKSKSSRKKCSKKLKLLDKTATTFFTYAILYFISNMQTFGNFMNVFIGMPDFYFSSAYRRLDRADIFKTVIFMFRISAFKKTQLIIMIHKNQMILKHDAWYGGDILVIF